MTTNPEDSPTPRTDAKSADTIGYFSCATVPAEFARELERELAESRAREVVLKQDLATAIEMLDAKSAQWFEALTQPVVPKSVADGLADNLAILITEMEHLAVHQTKFIHGPDDVRLRGAREALAKYKEATP